MIKKIAKSTFSILMIITVLFAYTVSPMPVEAATTTEPKTLGDLKNNLAALKKQKADNEASQKYTESQIKEKQAAIANAEAEITQAEADTIAAEEKIEESNEKIAELKVESENLLKFLQQIQSSNVYLEYLSDASSITDLVMRVSAIEQMTSYIQDSLGNLEQLIKENEQLKIDLAKKQEELEAKIGNYQAKITTLYGNLESYDKFALDIDTQIKVAQQQVNEYSKLCASSKNSYLGDNELLTDCVDVPYNAGWLKPLTKGRVTSTFGWRYSPITGKGYEFHSGIDIGGNAEGTPIYAAAAGVVSGIVEKYSCGGNMVYINVTVGGVKYTTYYFHLLTINVKVGQVVTQNTVIGTQGGYSTSKSHGGYDGCTTGTHLHFGVAKGYYSGSIPKTSMITPPGFNNVKGYSFSSRTAYYG